MAVAAIDCAIEANMPTCREYEVMGYPTIKFFSPNTPAGDMGHERQARDKTIPTIEADMVKFLRDLQLSGNTSRIGNKWPKLVPANIMGSSIPELWIHGAKYAILLINKANSELSSQVILDLSETLQQLQVPLSIRTIDVNSQSQTLLESLKLEEDGGGMVAVAPDMEVVDRFTGVGQDRRQLVGAVKDFIWKHSAEFSIKDSNIVNLGDSGKQDESKNDNEKKEKLRTASRKEIMSRRYRAYMSDLEKAVVYAISHEVAQHNSITSHTLTALQQFVTVLEKFFPARIEMSLLLRELKTWVLRHQDTIRGEDLSSWFSNYQSKHSFSVADHWIGCKGSEDMYGGYPCGLWTLWHVLTVNQANMAEGDSKEVLLAMKNYVQEFFGCRECARHFDQAIESGKLIDAEVSNYKDAVLLLWFLHNKANYRLSGDISEDPVFPKQTFPSKEFCSSCYDNTVRGTNLWVEFNRGEVFQFLKNLYSRERLSSQGLSESSAGEEHGVAIVPQVEENVDTLESLDMSNYKKEVNSGSFIFFNGADISICFFLWFISAVLLVLIYLKFVAGTKFSNTYLFNGLKRKTSSLNPLLGKV